MSKRKTSAESDIWTGAQTLSPDETRDTRVHVSLRLDADAYRQILARKKADGDRTITSTIEKLLMLGLQHAATVSDNSTNIELALRSLIAHGAIQDDLIAFLASKLEIRSPQEQALVETFLSHRLESDRIGDVAHADLTNMVSLLRIPEPPPARSRHKK